MCVGADDELRRIDAARPERVDLVEEDAEINDHTVADDRDDPRGEDAGRK